MGRHVLPFLGQRKYLHGTTLLDALLADAGQEKYPSATSFSFKLERPLLTNNVEWHTPCDTAEEAHAHAIFRSRNICLAVRPLPPYLPVTHEPFDEQALCSGIVFDTTGPAWSLRKGESPVQFSVLSFKHWLLRERPITEPGQWLFVRMDGAYPIPQEGNMHIEAMPQKIPSLAMAKIYHQKIHWSTLYFAWHNIQWDNS